MPQENPAYTDEEKATFRADPEQLPELHDDLARDVRRRSPTRSSTRTRRDQDDRGRVPRATSRTTCTTPSCASGCGPTTAPRASGSIISPNFYDAIQQPERRARHRGDRADRAGRRAHARRAAARARRARARDRLQGRRVHAADGGRSAATARRSPRRGRRARTRTCRSRSPTSRTSSCSTARTARSATSRSSRSPSCSSRYIMQLIERLRSGECREISADAARRWRRSRRRAPRRRKNTVWVTGCRSWYLDDRGIPATWPWSFDRFRAEMAAPDLSAYELR